MATQKENAKTKSIKSRISRPKYRGGYFFLNKGEEEIALPLMTSSLKNTDVEPYLKIATKIDGAINDFYRFTPEEDTHFMARDLGVSGVESYVSIRYHSSTHANIARAYRPVSFRDRRWLDSQSSPRIGSIQYHKNGSVKIYIHEGLDDIVEALMGTNDAFFVLNTKKFAVLIDDLKKAIDNLFTEQGFEPTDKRRKDLISLICGVTDRLVQTEEIQNLLEVDGATYKINHPNLIQAAAQGINEDLIRLFYIADVYPKSIEEAVELTSMPFDMLYKIWYGQAKG